MRSQGMVKREDARATPSSPRGAPLQIARQRLVQAVRQDKDEVLAVSLLYG